MSQASGGRSSLSSLPVTCCLGGFVAVCLLSLLSRLFALTQYDRNVDPLASPVVLHRGWSLVSTSGRIKDLKVRQLLGGARNGAGVQTYTPSSLNNSGFTGLTLPSYPASLFGFLKSSLAPLPHVFSFLFTSPCVQTSCIFISAVLPGKPES